MEKQTKSIALETQAKVDFNLTKDDIYLVLQEEKIQDINIKINDLKKQIEDIENTQENIKKDIINKIKKLNKIPIDFDHDSFFNTAGQYIKLYDMEYLSQLKNFRKSINSKNSIRFSNTINIKNSHVNIYQKYEDSEGFIINKGKQISLKSNKTIEDLIKKYNSFTEVLEKLYIETNELEYEILTITSDNSYKAKFIKQIIKDSPEIMKLLK
jgi:DNA-binding protein H-NS